MSFEPDGHQHDPIEGPGQTLFEFVRHWSRRSNTLVGKSIEQNGRHVLVVEAVKSVAKRETATINAVALEIGIDQSGASRLAKDALQAGYLESKPSTHDARQRQLSLSRAGQQLLVDAHRWQNDIFHQLTAGWGDDERMAFHRAMLRLLESSHKIATRES